MFSLLNSKYKIVCALIVVLLIAGGAIFLFSGDKNSTPSVPLLPNIPSQQEENTVVQESDESTANQAASSPVSVPSKPSTASGTNTPQQITLKGTFVCLPHRDTSGPITMECAFGLKAADNSYYALDTSASGSYLDFPTGTVLTVKGEFVPIEMISSNIGKIYNIKGIIRTTSTEVEVK